MWRKSKILKIIAAIIGLIILAIGLGIFFLLGGFKNFEKNKAQLEIAPFTSLIKELGGEILCDSNDKGLDPFSGSAGLHSYASYYAIKDGGTLVENIKNLAQQKGYVLTEDLDYIENLRHDATHPNLVTWDRAGITYNAESEYMKSSTAPIQGHYLYIRVYRNSGVVLTCKDREEQQRTAEKGEAILYIFAHGF